MNPINIVTPSVLALIYCLSMPGAANGAVPASASATSLTANVADSIDHGKLSAKKFKTNHVIQNFSDAGHEYGVEPESFSTYMINHPTRVVKASSFNAISSSSWAADKHTVAVQMAIDLAIVRAKASSSRHVVNLESAEWNVSLASAKHYRTNFKSFWDKARTENKITATERTALGDGSQIFNVNGTVHQALLIWGDNIVLRGTGDAAKIRKVLKTSGGVIEDMRDKSILVVLRSGLDSFRWNNTENRVLLPLTVDVNNTSYCITVSNATSFAVGDYVVVRSFATQNFIDKHDPNGTYWSLSNSTYKSSVTVGSKSFAFHNKVQGTGFFRKIIAKDGNKLTLDLPLRYSVLMADGACIYKMPKPIIGVGVENLYIGAEPMQNSSGTPLKYQSVEGFKNADYAKSGTAAYKIHASGAIRLMYVSDSWIRSVSSYDPTTDGYPFHLLSHGLIMDTCKNMTVSNSSFKNSQYLGEGGNGYGFLLRNSSDCLIIGCDSSNTRHPFSILESFSSGNVITGGNYGALMSTEIGKYWGHDWQLNCDFHMYLSPSNLVDNVTLRDTNLECKHRAASGSAGAQAGPTGIYNVFWNIKQSHSAGRTAREIVSDQPDAFGYIVGGNAVNVSGGDTYWSESARITAGGIVSLYNHQK